MITYIALLRGINVSGSNLIRMDALKICMERIGLISVRTYIQSGNLVFVYPQTVNSELEKLISTTILSDFGCKVPVLVKKGMEFQEAIASNPFILGDQTQIETLHITFLSGNPQNELLDKILPLKDSSDEAIIIENRIYLNCPNGYGRTKFTNTYFEKKLKQIATTRNWKTMLKLKDMADAYSPEKG
jgi:uncharacterized protein (DUF1697 family)